MFAAVASSSNGWPESGALTPTNRTICPLANSMVSPSMTRFTFSFVGRFRTVVVRVYPLPDFHTLSRQENLTAQPEALPELRPVYSY